MTILLKKIYHFFLKSLSPISRLKISYFRTFKKWPTLKSPKTFNEKVLHRIAYDQNPIFVQLADKFTVRSFIESRIGSEVLIPLVLETKQPDDLLNISDWSQTVLKPNHAAGLIEIFDENPSLDVKQAAIENAKKWLSVDFSKILDEWHYSLIEPRILLEKKITQKNEIPRDYKFHCFRQPDGSINYVLQLVDGRFGQESRAYYLNSFENCVRQHGHRPHQLTEDEKQSLSSVLKYHDLIMGNDFKYMRIDWYLIENKIYFGEITVTPGAGRAKEFGEELEKIMGDWWMDESHILT